jgi:hypothetical protein
MKTTRSVLACVAMLAGVLAAGSALAWGHSHARVGVGFYFGVPYAGYPYYYPPYPYYYPAYYPPPVVVQQQAPVYVEQSPPAAQAQPSNYWYYCAPSRAYYPYVKDCPGGWQRVAPQPQ